MNDAASMLRPGLASRVVRVQGRRQSIGDRLTGDPVAGDPVAGHPVAGHPVAGHPVTVDRRIRHRLIRDRRLIAALGVALTLALAAAAMLGQGLWIVAKAQLAQTLIEHAWSRNKAHGSIAARPWSWADTHPVARLSFPRQQTSMIVLAGDSGRTLAFGPGWSTTSPLPAQGGNAVISGHRDTHFASLRDITRGDPIDVETVAGRIVSYRVVKIEVVDRTQTSVADDHGVDELTLVTCWPFDARARGGPLRLVVSAQRIPADGEAGA